ncbi:MAG TPA: HAD-IA family hydrolase [Candidatus Dormibacteraeota bacterium]|jgi:HAD superfamily hydrolase (TIGR01509 family)|nr:HAD-IA family hydrolase [Candidatus Dormibacteraeota bacterium]
MAIRAVVFDFDGLILETEVAILTAWREVYAEHGLTLPLELWVETLGTAEHWFDPLTHLAEAGVQLDREELDARRRRRHVEILAGESPLPGVMDYLDAAPGLGLRLGVASSSTHRWVDGHLERLGIRERFASVRCREDVARTKPDPALYLAAAADLGVAPAEAIAIEDAPNGVRAAKSAGMFCVAVPSVLTGDLDLGQADLRLGSLAELPLADLVRLAASPRGPASSRGSGPGG